jgi:acyl carrier protein
MPTNDQLREEIIQLAIQKCALENVLPDGDLSEILDSVQRLTLIVAIEDHYKICFEPDDDEAVLTLNDVVRLVAARLEDR